MPRPRLDPRTPLTELHVHLGAAVTPAIMWGIAHAQGIRLPTKDYWAFRDLITVGRRRRSFSWPNGRLRPARSRRRRLPAEERAAKEHFQYRLFELARP